MPASQIFNVVTEFRFDIAQAVGASNTLQGSIEKVSGAANNLILDLKNIGVGVAAQMGLGAGGMLSFLFNAVKASDKFYNSQLKLSNIMLSNEIFTGENAFEKSMRASEKSLERMSKVAKEFSLPGEAFANLTTGIFAALSVKGLDDSGASKSIDLTRQFMKSAPILGIDPAMYQGNLLDMVMGQGSMGDRMTQRLMAETKAMEPFKGSLKGFNALPAAKRLDTLTKALAQFSSNAKINEAVLNSVSAQLRLLGENMTGMFSFVRHIGEAIREPMIKVLKQVNEYIVQNGDLMAKNFGKIIRNLVKDPEKLFVNLRQLANLKTDVDSTSSIFSLITSIHGLGFAFGFLTRNMGVKLPGFIMSIGSFVEKLGHSLSSFFMPIKTVAGAGFLRTAGALMMSIAKGFAALLFIFQVFSRASAKAEVSNAKWLADNLPKITGTFAKLAEGLRLLFLPVELAIDGLSDMVKWFFELEYSGGVLVGALDMIANAFHELGDTVLVIFSLLSGLIGGMLEFVMRIVKLQFKGISNAVVNEFAMSYKDFYDKYKSKDMNIDDSAISNTSVKIDKVEINQAFKEQAEPDRIAFAVQETLLKAALNPTQSNGRSFQGGFLEAQ